MKSKTKKDAFIRILSHLNDKMQLICLWLYILIDIEIYLSRLSFTMSLLVLEVEIESALIQNGQKMVLQ